MQGGRAGLSRRHVPDGLGARRPRRRLARPLRRQRDEPASRWTTAQRPSAGSRSRRCRTARLVERRRARRRRSGLDHAALEQAALGAAEGGIERQRCRPAAGRRSRGRAPRWRGRATRAAPRPGRSRWRGGGAAPAAAGRCLAASENWLTALARARCSSAAWRSMPAGSRARSALPRAARRVSTADRRASSSGEWLGGSLERGHQPCTLARSSWALAISLSAIASGLTLKMPSAMAPAMRATLSASNSPEAPPESSVDAVLDRATVALASTFAAPAARDAGGRLRGGLGRRGWRAGGRWPAAACQRDVRSSWGSPGGAGGAGTVIMDGLSARPATTLEISATTP